MASRSSHLSWYHLLLVILSSCLFLKSSCFTSLSFISFKHYNLNNKRFKNMYEMDRIRIFSDTFDYDEKNFIENHSLARVLMERLSKIPELTAFSIVRDIEGSNGIVVKSIIWRASIHDGKEEAEKYFCTVLDAKSKVDRRSLVEFLSDNLKQNIIDGDTIKAANTIKIKIGLADPIIAERVSGYPISAIPPLGHATPDIPILFDENLLSNKYDDQIILGGCGILDRYITNKDPQEKRKKNSYSLRLTMREITNVKTVLVAPVSISNLSKQNFSLRSQNSGIIANTKMPCDKKNSISLHEKLWSAASQKGGFSNVQYILSELNAKAYPAEEFEKLIWKHSNGGSKNILHRAAWKGDIETVSIILIVSRNMGIELIDSISTGMGNYGKSAIFYAITQDREDVVRLLITQGANLCIVNNKGQTPCSMSVSRFNSEMQAFMFQTEQDQLKSGIKFVNYRASHSDERQYGDLDPRFLIDPDDVNYSIDATLEILEYKEKYGDESLPRSVCVTTPEIRRAKLRKDNQSKGGCSRTKRKLKTMAKLSVMTPITGQNEGEISPISPSSPDMLSLERLHLSDIINTEPVIVDEKGGISTLLQAIESTEYLLRKRPVSEAHEEDVVCCSWSLDAEWKPNEKGEDNPVAILQLSTADVVFLIDMLSLCRAHCHPYTPMNEIEISLSNALSRIFIHERIPIVGYGLGGDLERLVGSYPHLKCFYQFSSVVDLVSASRIVYPTTPKGSINSLQKLCALILNKRLDKSEQCSPWHLRPLSNEQIEYAALDASVTISLLRALIADTNGDNTCFFNKNKHLMNSFRFTFFPDAPKNFTNKRVKRGSMSSIKQIMKNVVVKQSWHSFKDQPPLPDISTISHNCDVDVDKKRPPRIKLDSLSVDESLLDVGLAIGSSKGKVVRALIGDALASRLPEFYELVFNKKRDLLVMRNAIIVFLRDTINRDPHKVFNNDENLEFSLDRFTNEEKDILYNELKVGDDDKSGKIRKSIYLFMQPRRTEFIYFGRLRVSNANKSSESTLNTVIFDLVDLDEIRREREIRMIFRTFIDSFSLISTCIPEIPINEVDGYDIDNLPTPGNVVGGTKESCIRRIIDPSSTSDESAIVYNTRSGVIELSNMILLFINCANPKQNKYSKYRNDFFSNGRKVSFSFDSSKENEVAIYNGIFENGRTKARSSGVANHKPLLLFARPGKGGKFMYCGICRGEPMEPDMNKSRQLPIMLHILDYDLIVGDFESGTLFQDMVDEHTKLLTNQV